MVMMNKNIMYMYNAECKVRQTSHSRTDGCVNVMKLALYISKASMQILRSKYNFYMEFICVTSGKHTKTHFLNDHWPLSICFSLYIAFSSSSHCTFQNVFKVVGY